MINHLNEMLKLGAAPTAFTLNGEKIQIESIEKVFENDWILVNDPNGITQHFLNLSHVVRIEN